MAHGVEEADKGMREDKGNVELNDSHGEKACPHRGKVSEGRKGEFKHSRFNPPFRPLGTFPLWGQALLRGSSQESSNIFIYLLIAISLFLAFTPVLLSSNYIRQDDLMWEIWPGMKMSDFGYLYYNIVFEIVRPVCMFLLYVADLAAIDITHGVYVRLAGVLMICASGILLYRWQLLFNANRVLSACFATAAFTLPAYQVFAATGNYAVILAANLMTFGAAFCWYRGFYSTSHKHHYKFLGYLLFFASLLDYPLSSMFIWVLLAIGYLNTETGKRQFITFASIASVKMMVFYYIFCRIIHKGYHVHTNIQGSRVSVIDTSHLASKFKQVFDILGWHSNLWFWDGLNSFLHTPALIILGLFVLALIKVGKPALITLAMTLLFFFLAYSPILASPEYQITFRYAIATMPLLLYIVFWTINHLICSRTFLNKTLNILSSALCIALALFGLTYANIMVADGIVGPHTQDFTNVQQQLKEKVLPLLAKNQQVVIHGIACDKVARQYPQDAPKFLEYSMRICQYQQQVIGVIIHSLRKLGYASNFNKNNEVIYNTDEIIVNNTPWGTLIVNSTDNKSEELQQYTDANKRQIITIDTRELPQYQHLSFYKQLMN